MFAGRRYWIVGASEGLGRALAIALDAAGASLVISARKVERLSELAASLSDAQVLPMDVADDRSVAAACRELPEIDGMVYCVGLYDPMPAQDWDATKVLQMCEANFTGAVRVLGQIVPAFCQRGQGHLVLIGSLAGMRGLPGAIGYGASKAALMHLAENMRIDLAASGIRVQLVNPGYIRTRLSDKNDFAMPQIMSPEAAAARVLAAMQGRRFQTSFPAPFAWLFRFSRFLPDWLYLRVFRPR